MSQATSAPGGGKLLLVGFDGSEPARDGLELGLLLATALDGKLRAIWVTPDEPEPGKLGSIERALEDLDVALDVVKSSSAPRALHEEAERLDAFAVVLGSTHRGGMGRVFPGSVATRLLHGAPCAVAVAPRGYATTAPPDVRVIQIAVDGSPESWRAVADGGELAAAAGATVRLFAVEGPPRSGTGGVVAQASSVATPPVKLGEYLHDVVRQALESLPPGLRPDGRVLKGDVAGQLRDEAEKGVDLLVMGSRGYGPVHYALVGSVSASLTRDAPCPVLLVPRGD